MVIIWDGVTSSSQASNADKGKGRKTRKPVNFVVNILITEVDEVNGKFKGVGLTGSITAQDFMYQEIEYDIPEAGIETTMGDLITIKGLKEGKNVYVHGKNNRDGTLTIKRIVVPE